MSSLTLNTQASLYKMKHKPDNAKTNIIGEAAKRPNATVFICLACVQRLLIALAVNQLLVTYTVN